MRSRSTLHVHDGIAVWAAGLDAADIDVWFLHAFADSHLSFRDAFAHLTSEKIRIFLFDLPGHGASPPRPQGLTIEEAARSSAGLIGRHSGSRRVTLVAHSMAAIIATRVAQTLRPSPRLIISVEGNLTLADAYLSGRAADFEDPVRFYESYRSRIREMAKLDDALHRYSCSVAFADPVTLWSLGRSVLDCPAPGADYLNVPCPSIYYWDPLTTTAAAKSFLAEHDVRNRKTPGVGHWPMVTSPATFYGAVEDDVLKAG
jgi:pimeloyl-ACP methyl ester carboxylesterase